MLVRKTYMVLNKERTELIPITLNQISIEKLIFRLSYQDANLLNNSLQYQMEQLSQGGEQAPEKKEEEILTEKKLENDEETESPGLTLESTILDKSPSSSPTLLGKSVSSPNRDQEETKEDLTLGDKNAIIPIEINKEKEKQDDWQANTDEFNIVSKGIQIVNRSSITKLTLLGTY